MTVGKGDAEGVRALHIVIGATAHVPPGIAKLVEYSVNGGRVGPTRCIWVCRICVLRVRHRTWGLQSTGKLTK